MTGPWGVAYVKYVDSTPEAVGEGIAHWVSSFPEPWKVREAWLEKARPHREAFQKLMKELTGHACGRPPHKLGLRTPHPGHLYSLGIKFYLLLKGMTGK